MTDGYVLKSEAVKVLDKAVRRYPVSFFNGISVSVSEIGKMEPDASVSLQKAAEWRYLKISIPGGGGQTTAWWSCSSCKKRERRRSAYCRGCGAKMVTKSNQQGGATGENKMKETIIRQYRKKPVIVEAVQLDNINVPCVVRWIGEDRAKMNLESEEAWKLGKAPPVFSVTICTLEGNMKAMPGDYIIRGVNGEFYPCKPDIFEKTYEAMESPKGEMK